jgi:hypothetical protein
MEVPQLTKLQLVAQQEELQLLKQEKQSYVICLALAVQAQLLVLRCCSLLMLSFARVDTLQPDNWQQVFETTEEVLVTSSMI